MLIIAGPGIFLFCPRDPSSEANLKRALLCFMKCVSHIYKIMGTKEDSKLHNRRGVIGLTSEVVFRVLAITLTHFLKTAR
jgi:hypothetical protein